MKVFEWSINYAQKELVTYKLSWSHCSQSAPRNIRVRRLRKRASKKIKDLIVPRDVCFPEWLSCSLPASLLYNYYHYFVSSKGFNTEPTLYWRTREHAMLCLKVNSAPKCPLRYRFSRHLQGMESIDLKYQRRRGTFCIAQGIPWWRKKRRVT